MVLRMILKLSSMETDEPPLGSLVEEADKQ
jgi:hypothetical protein